MSKLFYFAHTSLRSGRVTAIQIMNTCAALSQAGRDVTLVDYSYLLSGGQRIQGDFWAHYGLTPSFRRLTLPTVLWLGAERIPGLVGALKTLPMALFSAWLWARRPFTPADVVYSRCYTSMMFMLRVRENWPAEARPKLLFEAHEKPPEGSRAAVLQRVDGVVCISQALQSVVVGQYGIAPRRSTIEYDAVDLEKFTPAADTSQSQLRQTLGLPTQRTIACYAGNLHDDEITVLHAAAARLGPDTMIVVVGGTPNAANHYQSKLGGDSLLFVGPVAHHAVPQYLHAADILLMPYTGQLPWSAYFSPVKLFEYMAARRPIISSDLPALREVLVPDQNACLVSPGRGEELADAISRVAGDTAYASQLVRQAAQLVANHSWAKRAERLLEFFESV